MTQRLALALAVSTALSCSQPAPPVASTSPAPEPTSEPAAAAPSEPPPEPSPPSSELVERAAPAELELATVDATLQALVGTGRGLSAAELLLRLGFDADSVASLNASDVSSAKRLEDNLDADEDLESVIVIDASLPSPGGGAPGRQVYLVWAEAGPPLSSIGRMRFEAESCAVEAAIDVELAPVHSAGFADTVVAVESSRGCDGNLRASHRTTVLTLERRKLETLLDFTDQSEVARDSGKTLDPALRVVFAGKPPRIAELRDDAKRTKKRLSFQPAPFVYR